MGQNKILPLVGGLVLIMLMVVGFKSCNSGNLDNAQLSAVPVPGTPDADSPADTIRTLTAEVAAIKSESNKLNQQNEALLRQRDDIERRVKSQLKEELMQDYTDNDESVVSGLAQQVDYFKAQLEELSQAQGQNQQGLGDIPVGFGLSGQDGMSSAPQIIWVEPLGGQQTGSDTETWRKLF